MLWLDRLAAEMLVPLAAWVFASSLDDLFLDISFLVVWLRSRWQKAPLYGFSLSSPPVQRERKIALAIPCWEEAGVVREMLENNLTAIKYGNYEVWLGLYPNDRATIDEVVRCKGRFPRIPYVICPHPGPTTKADCLNSIMKGIRRHEEATGGRYEIFVQHDAEDVIPPSSLRVINDHMTRYDMVQFPVFPLATPLWDITHGTYGDEFAEFHLKELPIRVRLGGFLPSAGVGTAYRREALEKLLAAHGDQLFDPSSLTEDYFTGLELHRLGCKQLFLRVSSEDGARTGARRSLTGKPTTSGPFAVRSYFPRSFRKAIRQRARWITGIGLQSWQRFGWRAGRGQWYWLWRDRKGLVGHPVALLANALFCYGLARWVWAHGTGTPWHFGAIVLSHPIFVWLLLVNFGTLTWRLAVRSVCSGMIYGWGSALTTPVRAPWANLIKFCATWKAVVGFALSRLHNRPLQWAKTSHAYPSLRVLMKYRRRLGDVLVASRRLSRSEVEQEARKKQVTQRLGEHLVESGRISELELYESLSKQYGLPFRSLLGTADVDNQALVSLPSHVASDLRVVPFQVDGSDRLWLASPELPTELAKQTVSSYSSLTPTFLLITPTNYNYLVGRTEAQPDTPQMTQAAAGD